MKKFFLVLTTLMICLGNIYAQDVRTVNKESDSKQSEQKIEDVKKRWPPHSVKPALIQELENLESELEELYRQAD